jgi:23S rRNA (uracil1939-C5)-methyltransferase
VATNSDGDVTASIRDLTHDGRGVADLDGRRVFVAGALPAEQVLIRPRRRRRRWADAELVNVIVPSAQRVEAGCEYFGRCGGCAVQHMDYPAQIEFKQGVVAEAFERIGGLAPEQWLEPVAGPQWNYRRRARLGVKYVAGKQRVLVGFRERAAPYVTDMTSCRVLARPMDRALGELAAVIADSSLRSQLPQIEVAMGDERGALVLRVLAAPTPADEALFQAFGERYGLDIYLQTGGPGTIEALGGAKPPLSYALEEFGLTFEFAPTDFVQINAAINARIVAEVLAFARAGACGRVLDLFCGLGNFSLPLAKHAQAVLGVEGEAGLVARAARNAELNGIVNAKFVAADLAAGGWGFLAEPWDLVVLDPPRTGAEAVVTQIATQIETLGPQRLAYVSCHPATLARDAGILAASGYRLTAARVFDMFPQTYHVETMALFERGA